MTPWIWQWLKTNIRRTLKWIFLKRRICYHLKRITAANAIIDSIDSDYPFGIFNLFLNLIQRRISRKYIFTVVTLIILQHSLENTKSVSIFHSTSYLISIITFSLNSMHLCKKAVFAQILKCPWHFENIWNSIQFNIQCDPYLGTTQSIADWPRTSKV